MKDLILVMFCLGVKAEVLQIGLTVSSGIDLVEQAIGPIEENNKPSSKKRVSQFARDFGGEVRDNEEDVTNENNFVYPCRLNDSNGLDCIRQYMAANSDCTPAYGPVPEPLCLTQNTAYFPSHNFSFTNTDVKVHGLSNASIYSFYYNKMTSNLVLAIKVPSIFSTSPRTFIIYRRPGQESIVKSDCSYGLFKSLIFTAVIPMRSKLRLDLADIHPYIGDNSPDASYFGPGARNSTDPIAAAEFADFLENMETNQRENFLFLSQLYTAVYIQSNICNFKLKLYSF